MVSKIESKIKKIKNLLGSDLYKIKNINTQYITDYYSQSNLGYMLLHSYKKSLHISMNKNKLTNAGYYYQAKFILDLILSFNKKYILEIGCGKGFNLKYLNSVFKNKIRFVGIDITNKFVKIAKKHTKLPILKMDFHQLKFNPTSFDLIYAIESFCHSIHFELALKQVYDVLKKDGLFVIFDWYRTNQYETLTEDLKESCWMVEKSVAINNGQKLNQFLQLAETIGFKIILSEDHSDYVLENLKKFTTLTDWLFRYTYIFKIIKFFLPLKFVLNAIAGLLMYYTVSLKAQKYYKIVLQKQ